MPKPLPGYIRKLGKSLIRFPRRYWQKGIWQKIVCLFWAVLILSTGVMYGIAQWYIASEKSKPMVFGASFIPDYASALGVDPQATMDGMLNVGVRHFRLFSVW